MAPVPPGNVGQRLLPSIIDEIAQHDPSRILYSINKTKDPVDGFEDITFKAFAKAVDRCAWHLEKTLGHGHNFPTLLYMGPQDVVYAILIIACIKTGYKLLLSSPRNTLEAHLSLLEKMECSTMLLPQIFPLPVIKQIQAARKMQVLEIPSAQFWLDSEDPVVSYPFTKRYAEAKSEPWIVLHTSGSTGVPKPIIQSHATYSALDAFTALPTLGLQDTYPAMCKGRRVYLGFPLFHCAGVSMLLPASIFAGFTVVLGPFPPSPDIVNAVHLHGNVQESCIAPSTLVDIAKDASYLENLRKLDQITYGGGSLPQAIGDLVSSRTRLANVLGSTEAGILPHHLCDPEDWAYMSLSPVLGHEYRLVSDGLYEHVIVKSPRQELRLYQGVFGTFPELAEWSMRDLYSKHPTKENVWIYRGRNDDIIVFSTGEKLNPVDMESIIQSHPDVNGAVICGVGRFQSSLLIEAVKPPTSEVEQAQLLASIWPSVQMANIESPSHGRIHRDMILFTTADKPMPRAGKGTVQRQATLDLYAAEIEALYELNSVSGNGKPRNQFSNPAEAVKSIVNAATNNELTEVSSVRSVLKGALRPLPSVTLPWGAPPVGYPMEIFPSLLMKCYSDLFELGLDSLQASVISKETNEYLATLGQPRAMEPRFVYSHPNIDSLVTLVTALALGQEPSQKSPPDSAEEKMQKLYELLASDLPVCGRRTVSNQDTRVVLLTGSTGSLGSYVLDQLLADSRVTHIYCLNRGPNSLQRQQRSQSAKGLDNLTDKVTCLDADLLKDSFGLPDETYHTLLYETTHIIHNAWQVDFNLVLESFSPQLHGVRRLVDFSTQSQAGAKIFFISSISAVANVTHDVPEQVFDDWRTPQAIGYGQSKFVAECVLDTAAKVANVPAVICRVGQIAGPTTAAGVWTKQEWLPSLVASSRYLGKIPSSLGRMETVDWIPVDCLGRIIVELAIGQHGAVEKRALGAGAIVYHTINPKQISWKNLVKTISDELSDGGPKVETVPLDVWLEELRRSASEEKQKIAMNPAVKILEYYEGLTSGEKVSLITKETVRASPTLSSLGSVNEVWMKNWLKQWSF